MGRIRKTIESVSVSVGIGSSRAAYVVTVLRTDPERMWVGGKGHMSMCMCGWVVHVQWACMHEWVVQACEWER